MPHPRVPHSMREKLCRRREVIRSVSVAFVGQLDIAKDAGKVLVP